MEEKWNWRRQDQIVKDGGASPSIEAYRTDTFTKHSQIDVRDVKIMVHDSLHARPRIQGSKDDKIVAEPGEEFDLLARVLLENVFQSERMKMEELWKLASSDSTSRYQ